MNIESYAEKIKQARADRNLTQIQAAAKIDIGLESLRQIEQGKAPGPRVKKKLDEWLAKKKG
jgi:transcriptional regulator with XRE-family HTH domain